MVPSLLSDEELVMLLEAKHIRSHMLEKTLNNDYLRGKCYSIIDLERYAYKETRNCGK